MEKQKFWIISICLITSSLAYWFGYMTSEISKDVDLFSAFN
ncbi:MAG: hypothetical protein ACFFAJ_12620 [Candidatus Hodarchaeota archaeon]